MSDAPETSSRPGEEVREPENSTVDDWMGQDIARDEEVAERVAADSDTLEEAEAAFEEQATGEQTHAEGYPRPADERPDPAAPVGDESP
jgi:hypothetical protein